ncbi:hypothetical protein [Urbifossiella limnaea]|uniref:Outer membrane protein beta-barrel domain-containing protein n=1 Tax=Urbifossiella limnaea TaxID=2528023 RepID=A0A517XVQ5_9BACT|nr:hypothetical protein [Urbifossiella limnaea]QDU21579.1 hypothetical protein ETAA1_35490 [Urbifossiella limnaea]
MTITRMLPGVVLAAAATAAPAAGQYGFPTYTPPTRMSTPAKLPAPPPSGGSPVLPTGGQETAPAPRPVDPGPAASLGAMTSTPAAGALPPGAYGSPWYTDGPGCCGPLGRNGQVAYELHAETGPNLLFGSGEFTDRLHTGWIVGGGGRTLFFNPEGDAAWTLDLGLSYTYNRGSSANFSDVFIRQPPGTNQLTGQIIPRADILTTSRIRALHRTAFNFAVGRDCFVWGPGNPGEEAGWNVRTGLEVGGRWGTSHVDLVPNNAAESYSRRQAVFHGFYLSGHVNYEVPVGGWVWFGGLTGQYGYDWTNVIPPLKGDVQNVNILLSSGIRF